jgi:hypothetical protein
VSNVAIYGSSNYVPYGEFVSTMNDVTDRWRSIAPREAVTQYPTAQKGDPELHAAHQYLSGKVPEKGSGIVELINRMTF